MNLPSKLLLLYKITVQNYCVATKLQLEQKFFQCLTNWKNYFQLRKAFVQVVSLLSELVDVPPLAEPQGDA